MKKSLFFMILLLFSLHSTMVSAVTFSDYFPGGKNYINPDNITIGSGVVTLQEEIYVKSNQVYTFSFPNRDLIGENIFVMVEGETVYVDEIPFESVCRDEGARIACTFITSPTEDRINITVHSDFMNMYIDYYGLELFQLEEGAIVTEWEQYVPPFTDSTSPEFSGTGAYVTSYSTVLPIDEIISSHIVAYDEIDGDISDRIVVEYDEYTGNETIVGDYLVELSVSDIAGNQTVFDLYVIVKDEIAPNIVSPDDIFISVDDSYSISEIIDIHISYYDEYDTSPTLTIVEDQYTSNMNTIGVYPISISVEDASGNSTSHDFNIYVKDFTPPELNGSTMIDIDVSSVQTIDEIINALDVIDNYDSEVDIGIEYDGYTGYEEVVGTYFIDVVLIDDSGNETFKTLTISVSDNSSPVIDGPTDISISYTEAISLESIKEMYTITDNYDTISNSDFSVLIDEYSNNSGIPGTYTVELSISDTSGNTTTISLQVIVVDDVNPIIFIDQHIVVVEQGSTFGIGDMMRLLRASNLITNEEYDIEVIQDEYAGSEEQAGDYIFKVLLTSESGSKSIREFKITVPEEEKQVNYKMPIIFTSIGLIVVSGAIFYRKFK